MFGKNILINIAIMQLTHFHYPEILIFILIILWWWILLWTFYQKREKLKKKYFLLFNQSKYYYITYILLFLSIFTISIWIFEVKYWEKVGKQKVKGIDIVFIVDVSKSMNALDFKEWWYHLSRLDFTKALISEYIWKHAENRYGLVIFAGDAISASPLTTDHSTFLTFLQNVDYRNLTKQWSNIEKAIELWVNRLYSQKSEEVRAKSLIIMSDWGDEWDTLNTDVVQNIIWDKKITHFVIWIGQTSGSKIPNGQNYFGDIIYQKYKWKDVITKLNSSLLSSLASTLDGNYKTAHTLSDIETISSDLEKLEKKSILVAWWNHKKDLWRFIAIISLIFFILFLLLNIKKWKK